MKCMTENKMIKDYTTNNADTITKAAGKVYVVLRGTWAFDWIPHDGGVRAIDKIFNKKTDALKYLESIGCRCAVDDLNRESTWYPTKSADDRCVTTYTIKEFNVY